MARNMSDAEIRRRKKLQGSISHATGTLGLTALGGTLLATKTGSKATKAAFAAAGKERPGFLKPKKLRKATAPILATSAGIGGAGAFNFASYTNAESRKRKQLKPVVSKAWDPVKTSYTPEGQRQKRNQQAQYTAQGVAAGLGGAAVGQGAHAGLKYKKAMDLKAKRRKYVPVKNAAKLSGKKAGAFAAGAVGAAAVAEGIRHKRQSKSWQTYSKSAHGAFGIVHQ